MHSSSLSRRHWDEQFAQMKTNLTKRVRTASTSLDSAVVSTLDILGWAVINSQAVAYLGVSLNSAEDMATMEIFCRSMARLGCVLSPRSPPQCTLTPLSTGSPTFAQVLTPFLILRPVWSRLPPKLCRLAIDIFCPYMGSFGQTVLDLKWILDQCWSCSHSIYQAHARVNKDDRLEDGESLDR